MLNILWPCMILVAYSFAFFSGNIENINNAIFEYTR